jgi:nickel transport protein
MALQEMLPGSNQSAICAACGGQFERKCGRHALVWICPAIGSQEQVMSHRSSRRFVSGVALAGAIASFVVTIDAQAHGIWFAQRARQLALIYGIGADDLDMVRRLPLLNTVTGYDTDWKAVPIRLRAAGAIPVVESDLPYAATAATMDYGIWSIQPGQDWVNAGRDENPGATRSEHTFKYTVHIAKPVKSQMPLLAGHRLQIVPVGTEIPQESGKPFTVKVYFDGKPFAGAEILTDFVNDPDMPPMKTGPDGETTFRLRNQGLNVIAATIIGKTDQPKKYDYIEYRATLSFVLPHAEE